MITAIEARRQQDREHRGGAPSSTGAMPSFGAIADMMALASLGSGAANAGPVCPAPSQPLAGSTAAASSSTADLSAFVGRSVGSGQCVALVRAADPTLGPTATWQQGAAVQGNTALQPGTAIATFDAGRYGNATDGSSHAAIYLGQSSAGVTVLDQWAGKAAAVRTIPWSNTSGIAANTGAAFHVVRTG